MPTMLEQAIIDAQSLREAALKSAESAVIQKYSDEVRGAVSRLLEQDLEGEEDLFGDPEIPMDDMGAPDGEDLEVTVDVPMAHDPDISDDEVVIIDLDQIIAAADSEEGEEEEVELDAQDIADEIGVSAMDDDMVPNRPDDEIDLNESDLMDMFKEMLVVDVNQGDVEEAEQMAEEEEDEESLERVVSQPRVDGMEADAIEAADPHLTKQVESVQKENQELKSILVKVKDRLEEVNLSNARLLYANRVLQDSSLNEQQKSRIAELVSEARTVEEAKMVYETLQKTLASTSRKSPKSLSEAISRKSSVILSGNRKVENADEAPVKNRWATLAGIKK